MYNVVILDKLVIDEYRGIFVFVPKEVKTVEFKNFRCIDDSKNVYELISNNKVMDDGVSVVAGFPIDDRSLLNLFPDCNNIEDCKAQYFNQINQFVHIGFLLPTLDKIGVISKEINGLTDKVQEVNSGDNLDKYIAFFDTEKQLVELEDLELLDDIISDIIKIDDVEKMRNELEGVSDVINGLIYGDDYEANNKSNDEKSKASKDVPLLEKKKEDKKFDEAELAEKLAPSMCELNKLVGLETIKDEINKLIKYIIYREKTKEYLEFDEMNLNMVFTGNPGTGKTTVATILAKMLYNLGYLASDKTAFITAEKLIAGYVGQTAIKTREVLDSNKGGVIVIDEAYILASEHNKFGAEAIAEILKDMESRETAFIFAGYDKEMKDFLEMNSGLTSRIGINLNFPDYELNQLFEMLMNKINRMNKGDVNKLHLSEDAILKVTELIENDSKCKDFGNARYINNLADNILRNKANTVDYATSLEDLLVISEENIPNKKLEKKVKVIGFQSKK